MRTLKLTIAYDGAPFVGWQRQAAGVSVQGLIEEALSRLDGAPVAVIGAGRTDAGVHAAGQVASAVVDGRHDVATVRRALNAVLPPEVRVLGVEEAGNRFHARFSAKAKTYQYWISDEEVVSPFLVRRVWHAPGRLDVTAMHAAAEFLEGRHDFAAFRSTGSDVRTTERTVFRSACWRVDTLCDPLAALARHARDGCPAPVVGGAGCGDRADAALAGGDGAASGQPGGASGGAGTAGLVVYEICGDGFLRHMVRAIAGTLVEVGRGRLPAEQIRAILSSRARERAGPTAPASGLVLMRVEYE